MTLEPYRKLDNCIIAGVVDENDKIKCFTVADMNLERVTNKSFTTPHLAFEWAENNYKGLI